MPSEGDVVHQPTAAVPAVHNLSTPKELNIEGTGAKESWMEWEEEWSRYIRLLGLNRQTLEYKKDLFIHCIGADTRRVYKGMTFGDGEDKDNPDDIIKKFDEYFCGMSREHIERFKFYSRSQLSGESFEQFLSELRNLTISAGICNCMQDKMIMDRIMLGHKEEKVLDKLSAIDKPDLKAVVNVCRAMEVTSENMKVLKRSQSESINKVSQKKMSDKQIAKCKFCTQTYECKKEKCPAWGRTSNACRERNHFANSDKCEGGATGGKPKNKGRKKIKKKYKSAGKSRSKSKCVHAVDTSDSSVCSSSEESISTEGSICAVTVSGVSDPKNKLLYCNITIDGSNVVHQIDPGATVCVLPFRYIGVRPMRQEKVALKMWNGNTVSALGKCKVKVRNKKTLQKWNIDYVIVDDKRLTPLLSRKAAETMGLITVNYENFEVVNSVQRSMTKEDFLRKYPTLWDGKLGRLPGVLVHLIVEKDIEPVISPAIHCLRLNKDHF